MSKIIVCILFSFVFSNASIIHFEEEKFIEVLDSSVRKQGTLEFIDNKIKLNYRNSKRVLIYEDDTLSIKTDDNIELIDLKNQVAIKMIFILIESIYQNNMEIIKEYFTIKKENNIVSLIKLLLK